MSLNVEKLTVTKEGKNIISNINFSHPHGEVLGLIGENGAGKTTLLHALVGKNQFAGDVSYKEINYIDENRKEDVITYCGDSSDLDTDLSAEVVLSYARFNQREDLSLRDELVDAFELNDFLQRSTTTLSGGEKQRLNLACSLYQGTDVVLWDEPTNYLDPRHVDALEGIISKYKSEKLFIISSHNLSFLLSASERVLALKKGVLRFYENKEEVISKKLLNDIFSKEFLYVIKEGALLVK